MALVIAEQSVRPCDLIFVLAGAMERKSYGLELFSKHIAPRLVLSVGRFEVRHTASLLGNSQLITLREQTPANQRHFWVDYHNGSTTVSLARLKRAGTFEELEALADYLQPDPPGRIAMISTSIHLRRIRFCCRKISFFAERSVSLWSVPEENSSFKRAGWWKRRSHWLYVISEYTKLVGYHLVYGPHR